MRSTLVILLVGLLAALMVGAQGPSTQPASEPAVRFAYVDVFIDSADQPLAAYQFELTAERGEFSIVGVEGGEHPAFADPPYYDPAALARDRIIIAAFNTGEDLPTGKTRVARIHVRITSEEDPEYRVNLRVGAGSDGATIAADASVIQGDVE